MRDAKDSKFKEVEKFLLDLALLLMLLGGLFRVIAPEVREVIRDLTGDNRPASGGTRTPESHAGEAGQGSLYGGR